MDFILTLGLLNIQSAFFDIGNDGVDLYDIGLLLGLIGTVYVGAKWLRKQFRDEIRSVQKEQDEKLEQRTEQIQPEANHGLSLTDLHAKFDELFEIVAAGDAEAHRLRREFSAVVFAVGIAVKLPVEERAAFWESVMEAYEQGYLPFRFRAQDVPHPRTSP